MTEAEWAACPDVPRMLAFLGASGGRWKCGARKWRLFGCACCRRLWPLLDETNRRAVDVAERFADKRATLAELKAARQPAEGASLDPDYKPVVQLLSVNAPHAASWAAHDARALVGLYTEHRTARGKYDRSAEDAEGQAQRDLLQDLIGALPFRPAATDPAWLHWNAGGIPKLAQAVYEERAFDRLPVLADALEEAGCTEPDLLGHLRGPGPHVRGCFALDLLLQKT
jgi:hypothetical protein